MRQSQLVWLTVGVWLLLGALVEPAQGDDPPSKRPIIDFDPDWTPRPVAGDVPWYMQETDAEWLDDRLRSMDTGRTWNATFRYAEHGPTPDPELKPAAGDPPATPTHRSFKGTAIRIGERGEAGMVFDRNQCRWACAWSGDFLWHKDRRFGLLNTPQPAGDVHFFSRPDAGWAAGDGMWPTAPSATGPLPADLVAFAGMSRHGDRTILHYRVEGTRVLEQPWVEQHDDLTVFTRTFLIEALPESRRILLWSTAADGAADQSHGGHCLFETAHGMACTALVGDSPGCTITADRQAGRIILVVPASDEPQMVKVASWRCGDEVETQRARVLKHSPSAREENIRRWTEPGPAPWPEPLVTRGEVAPNEEPLVIDTITVPYDNPYNALFFVSGVDFLPSGELAVSTVHGDVWLVSGVDDELTEIRWQRYATGLYQPLGLKVVDGDVFVLERGQLTRLHDVNSDGTADFHECFNADWHVGGGEHSFDTCLERDHDGYWYFHSTGDPHVPTGGTVIRVSPDGSTSDVFCTGFRHPIGMGVLRDGRITGADQEGNWMPSTRIDIYRHGGFYGDMRAHHRDTPPATYDGPLCWLPRQMDGSAGGQVSVPEGHWGPLGGRMLHMSFGRCRLMLLMMQRVGDVEQAGAVDLGLQFLAGIQRGRFRPSDGHLYLAGMDGWQTAAVADGCLQRVRYTGQPFRIPLDLHVEPGGLRLRFSTPLDRALAVQPERYHLEQWNYRWQSEYGSPRYSVANPDEEGQDVVAITSAVVGDDDREVFLAVPNLQPVMQMQIDYRLADTTGTPIDGVIYNTIHTTGE